jgi:hypothetical protein
LTYSAPSTATLTFDKHDLAHLIFGVRSGNADSVMTHLQIAADAAGNPSREIFEQAKTLSHSPLITGEQVPNADENPGIDGVLKDAYIIGGIAYGKIFDDRKGRFEDGTVVGTSRIVRGPDADGIIRTRNSTYRLEMASDAVAGASEGALA